MKDRHGGLVEDTATPNLIPSIRVTQHKHYG